MQNGRRRHLEELLPSREFVDPTVRVEALFFAVKACFERNDYRFGSDEPDLLLASQAIQEVARWANVLNKMQFWDDLEVSQRVAIPEDSADQRRRMIRKMRNQLSKDSVTQADLRHSMEMLDVVFRSMHSQFRFGRIPHEEGDEPLLSAEEKYMCAALLGAIVSALEQAWIPLLQHMPKRIIRSRLG